MGLQFPSCTTFELIEVFIPDQLHQELTAEEIMGLKMATQQEQGNWDMMGGRATEAGIITRVDEIWMSQNKSPRSIHWHRHQCGGQTVGIRTRGPQKTWLVCRLVPFLNKLLEMPVCINWNHLKRQKTSYFLPFPCDMNTSGWVF